MVKLSPQDQDGNAGWRGAGTVLTQQLIPASAPVVEEVRRLETGDAVLDVLLGGGLRQGTALLVVAPPFCGQHQFLQGTIRHALKQGRHVAVVLHSMGAAETSEHLGRNQPWFTKAESIGHITYVDVASHVLGEPESHPFTTYIHNSRDAGALADACAAIPDSGLVVVEAVGLLLEDLGVATALAFFSALVDRVCGAHGVVVANIQSGTHRSADLAAVRQRCDGVLEMRRLDGAYALRIEGLADADSTDWAQYNFDSQSFSMR